jgi:hypothetical protein
MNKRFAISVSLLLFSCVAGSRVAGAAAKAKVHTVSLGAVKHVPYSTATDPSGAFHAETELRVRALIIDGKSRDWTAGEMHIITDRSFTIRRAIRLNDALPGDKGEHWIWQRGPWLLIDRTTGHYTALKLPEYDPAVSLVIWYRDYAAYCGLSSSGKQLYAVVAQLGARKPVLSKKLGPWQPHANAPSDVATLACAAAAWQREPLRITFQHTGDPSISYDLIGLSSVLVEEGDGDEPANDSKSTPDTTSGPTP